MGVRVRVSRSSYLSLVRAILGRDQADVSCESLSLPGGRHASATRRSDMRGAVGMRAAIELCGHNSYIAASRFLDPYRWEREIARARDLRIIGRNAGAGHT